MAKYLFLIFSVIFYLRYSLQELTDPENECEDFSEQSNTGGGTSETAVVSGGDIPKNVTLLYNVSETANFDGLSYITKKLSHPIASEFSVIHFRFHTSHTDGVILYSQGAHGDFIALQLVNSQLLLNINLGVRSIVNSLSLGSVLDDDLWHDVVITHDKQNITLSVDRAIISSVIEGDFMVLNLKGEIFLGGVPNFRKNGISTTSNFIGCIDNFSFNDVNFLSELKAGIPEYEKSGNISAACEHVHAPLITFPAGYSHLKVRGVGQQPVLDCSFDFRTFDEAGILLYHQFFQGNYVKLFLEKGKMKIELVIEGIPKVSVQTFDRYLNDGHWHSMMLLLQKNRFVVTVDHMVSQTVRQFHMASGTEYMFGGRVYGSEGFVGCMRNIIIGGNYINPLSLPEDSSSAYVVLGDCQMTDRCNPNPCKNGGICKQKWDGFFCECERTGYTGAVCHRNAYALSCEAYRKVYPQRQSLDTNIDIDGSGPLKAFPVTCEFPSEGPAVTIVHHENERPINVKGFDQPGSFIQSIKYSAEMDQITQLLKHSTRCKQRLRYDCLNARLLNSPAPQQSMFHPFSWWVSRNNRQMDYWGGSLPGSRKCSCGLYGTCKEPQKWCNCDSEGHGWLFDEGDLTQKEHLPVHQLRFGDTGNATDGKMGRYMLGPLICQGDSRFDDAITFLQEDATVELPGFSLGYSADIYFEFKTTAQHGVLMASTGPTTNFKILLIGGDHIYIQQDSYSMELYSYNLSDNNWHSVHVEGNIKEFHMIVDGTHSVTSRKTSSSSQALHFSSKLVIGASFNYRDGFVGCMRAMMFNGESVDLRLLAHKFTYGVEPGCVGSAHSSGI